MIINKMLDKIENVDENFICSIEYIMWKKGKIVIHTFTSLQQFNFLG